MNIPTPHNCMILQFISAEQRDKPDIHVAGFKKVSIGHATEFKPPTYV